MKIGGGHFAPKLGGQFELESGGHFKLELGGQYHWNLHYTKEIDIENLKLNELIRNEDDDDDNN